MADPRHRTAFAIDQTTGYDSKASLGKRSNGRSASSRARTAAKVRAADRVRALEIAGYAQTSDAAHTRL
jgi:hypothetical protein